MGAAASCAARVIVIRYPRLLKLAVPRKRRSRRRPAAITMGPEGEAGVQEATPLVSEAALRVPTLSLTERAAYEDGMETTPKSAAKREYKYFCPICMRYFRAMFEAECCGNYMCYGCAMEFVARHDSHAKVVAAAAELRDGGGGDSPRGDVDPIRCPSCNVDHLSLRCVHLGAPVRSYDDEAGVPVAVVHSPVRVGDSYETLRRKMLSYEETGCCRDNVRKLFCDPEQPGDADAEPEPDGNGRPASPPQAAVEPISDVQAFARTFVMPILAA